MTREQAKQALIALGIESPTEEQISNYLNTVHGEVQKEKSKVDANKAELDRLKAIETEYENQKNTNLSAEEKYQKLLKDSEDRGKTFALEVNKMKAENILVGAGLKQEEYANLLSGLVSEDTDKTTSLATDLANLLKTTKEATEKTVKAQLVNDTPPPGGGNNATKTDGEKLIEGLAGAKAESIKAAQSTLNYYTGGSK